MPKKKKSRIEVESEYWEEIELTDPVTGEKTTQRVKVQRIKAIPPEDQHIQETDLVDQLNSYSTNYDFLDE